MCSPKRGVYSFTWNGFGTRVDKWMIKSKYLETTPQKTGCVTFCLLTWIKIKWTNNTTAILLTSFQQYYILLWFFVHNAAHSAQWEPPQCVCDGQEDTTDFAGHSVWDKRPVVRAQTHTLTLCNRRNLFVCTKIKDSLEIASPLTLPTLALWKALNAAVTKGGVIMKSLSNKQR